MAERTEAEKQFAKDLVARGQAAEEVDGKLPQKATHAITGYDKDGVPIIKRVRFRG